jgi:hypothetical protein
MLEIVSKSSRRRDRRCTLRLMALSDRLVMPGSSVAPSRSVST